MARGNTGQKIFNRIKDYKEFLQDLGKTKKKYSFKLYAYVLMPNHFHMLLEIVEKSGSKIMQSLLTSYSKYNNREHKRRGHVFQGRYKAVLCEKDEYLRELIRYIHMNPIRAGLVKEIGEWEWSSSREYTGESDRELIERGILSEIFGKGKSGYNRYREYMSAGLSKEYKEEFHPGESSPFSGSKKFKEKYSKKEDKTTEKRQTLDEILNEEIKREGINISKKIIRQKSRIKEISKIRREFIKKAVIKSSYRNTEVARYLNCDPSYITKVIQGISQFSQV